MPRPVTWAWDMLTDSARVTCPAQEVRVGRVHLCHGLLIREVRFHKDRNRENGCQAGRSGRWKPRAAALASLGGNLQDPSRFPSCSFGLMRNEKQNAEAASGQGVGGAQRCLLMESVISSFRVTAPPLISTSSPPHLHRLSTGPLFTVA